MTKGSDNSPKLNRPTQDNSWRDIDSQEGNRNNSNRHNNNPSGSEEAHQVENKDHARTYEKNEPGQDNDNEKFGGVSGRPNNINNHNPDTSKNTPQFQEGPVPGGADNTRGENVPSREGHGGGAKKGKADPESHSPQGSNSNPSDTRGSDSSDKEFMNNQPNASTLKGHKNSEGLGNEKE